MPAHVFDHVTERALDMLTIMIAIMCFVMQPGRVLTHCFSVFAVDPLEQFTGLATLPCHGLVDTGAGDGVIGVWHFMRWMANLALHHSLRPRYTEIDKNMRAGGVGGSATPIVRAEVPTAVAGVPGIVAWLVVEDPSPDSHTPALLPISLLKQWDTVLEPACKVMTLRTFGQSTLVCDANSNAPHQTVSMMGFSEHGFQLQPEDLDFYQKEVGGNPFLWSKGKKPLGYAPDDARFDTAFQISSFSGIDLRGNEFVSPVWHSPQVPRTHVPKWVRDITGYESYNALVQPPGCVNVMTDRPLSID